MSNNKPIVGAILTMIVFYLLISFSIWDLNAKNWSIVTRSMYSCFGPVFSIFVYVGLKLDQK